ncbi:hypothetical protein [Haloferax marisrubri]|uniref:DUF624 domain-containing protein n=1 Tax=Haloferax marisrubri TaxID=1544719 RepID=A0A2P4NM95_9EURY|nr:hypothetical protein [Haloferax marisrubri]POG54255.1 hypothetical protein AUR65_016555 [Haloferax marisrubri]
MSSETERLDPLATVSAFGRAAYSDLVTVIVVSLLFWIGSLPILTLGASLAAATETMRAVVDARLDGRGFNERSRIAQFSTSYRGNLQRGIPVSLALVGVAGVTMWYAIVGTAQQRGVFLVAALIGFYGFTIVTLLSFHAADFRTVEARLSLRDAFSVASQRALAYPSFTVLESTFAVLITILCVALGLTVVLVLPGLIALLTVVAGEETEGASAAAVVKAYRGERA